MKQEGLKTEHELQSYFIRRIEKFINAKGRTLIGWSEIREGGLAQNAVVMDWIGGAVEAASAGHDVIMSPTKFCYLDYYQSTNHATEPKAIGGYLPLSKVYSFEPMPAKLDPQYQSHILGAQGNLWTEYVPNFKHAQYMMFPRLCALAEVTWSPPASRNWEDFTRRLQTQFQRFDQARRQLPQGHARADRRVSTPSRSSLSARPIQGECAHRSAPPTETQAGFLNSSLGRGHWIGCGASGPANRPPRRVWPWRH